MRIMRIAMGVGFMIGILVLFPSMKTAIEAIITTVLSVSPMSSAFAQLVFETIPYWGLLVAVVCAILLMVSGRGEGA